MTADYNMIYQLDPAYLNISVSNRTDFYITNNSNTPVFFPNDNHIAAKDFPDFDQPYTANSPPGFYVCFNYGDKGGDICIPAQSTNISFSLKSGSTDDWDIEPSSSPSVGTYWKICPKRNVQLGPNESIVISITSILCNNALGNAPLNIRLRLSPGKEIDNQVFFTKKLTPVIESFTCKQQNYNIDDSVEMDWVITNADKCLVSFDGGLIPSDTNAKEIKAADETHTLLIHDSDTGYETSSAYPMQFTFIDYFRIKSGAEECLTLEWSALSTENKGCYLSYSPTAPQDTTGSDNHRVTQNENIILSAKQLHSPEKIHTGTINFVAPVIQFTAHWVSDSHNVEGFITPEELQSESKLSVVLPPYAAPDPPPPPPPPPPVKTVHVEWSVQNADSCYIEGQWVDLAGNKDIGVDPSSTSLTLKAEQSCGYFKNQQTTIQT
ncbi:MAG: hypothetical protein LBT16_02970 [Treponema sp.]|jgi:hypothetical protein|nr:hypothetical protein [Treponema sp.]